MDDPHNVFDAEVLYHIRVLADAAHSLDRTSFFEAGGAYSADLSVRQVRLASLYVANLIQFSLFLYFGHEPSLQELRALSNQLEQPFRKLFVANVTEIEKVLRSAFTHLSLNDDADAPALRTIHSIVVIGMLSGDPREDWEVMEIRIRDWCSSQGDVIEQLISD